MDYSVRIPGQLPTRHIILKSSDLRFKCIGSLGAAVTHLGLKKLGFAWENFISFPLFEAYSCKLVGDGLATKENTDNAVKLLKEALPDFTFGIGTLGVGLDNPATKTPVIKVTFPKFIA